MNLDKIKPQKSLLFSFNPNPQSVDFKYMTHWHRMNKAYTYIYIYIYISKLMQNPKDKLDLEHKLDPKQKKKKKDTHI